MSENLEFLEEFDTDQLIAMAESTRETGNNRAADIMQGIIDTRKADEYAYQAENEAYPDSTGTLT